jgi:hypothetical protein
MLTFFYLALSVLVMLLKKPAALSGGGGGGHWCRGCAAAYVSPCVAHPSRRLLAQAPQDEVSQAASRRTLMVRSA